MLITTSCSSLERLDVKNYCSWRSWKPCQVDDNHEVGLLRRTGWVGCAPAEARQLATTSFEKQKVKESNLMIWSLSLKPADGDWEGVEGNWGGGDFCVAVPLHHTQHKTEQDILSDLFAEGEIFLLLTAGIDWGTWLVRSQRMGRSRWMSCSQAELDVLCQSPFTR